MTCTLTNPKKQKTPERVSCLIDTLLIGVFLGIATLYILTGKFASTAMTLQKKYLSIAIVMWDT